MNYRVHLCFVVLLPTILVVAAVASERTAYSMHFPSPSGEKQDENVKESTRNVKHRSFWDVFCFSSLRWVRKFPSVDLPCDFMGTMEGDQQVIYL